MFTNRVPREVFHREVFAEQTKGGCRDTKGSSSPGAPSPTQK